LTIAETEIVGPPHAVNFSATENSEDIPGSPTDTELTTGHVCSPSVGTSLDCTRKPTETLAVGSNVNVEGAMENTGSDPVVCTVVVSGPGFAPCRAPIKLTLGRPSREQAEVEVFSTPTGL
jgi:hypothetical protein